MSEEFEEPQKDSNKKNVQMVICMVCRKSKILQSGHGTYTEMKKSLPPMRKKKNNIEEDEKEEFNDWWMVEDINNFENIGVTFKVGKIKYLACADCENGPVGYYDEETKKSYIAHARVLHKQSPPKK